MTVTTHHSKILNLPTSLTVSFHDTNTFRALNPYEPYEILLQARFLSQIYTLANAEHWPDTSQLLRVPRTVPRYMGHIGHSRVSIPSSNVDCHVPVDLPDDSPGNLDVMVDIPLADDAFSPQAVAAPGDSALCGGMRETYEI